jgi:hypothetical protein
MINIIIKFFYIITMDVSVNVCRDLFVVRNEKKKKGLVIETDIQFKKSKYYNIGNTCNACTCSSKFKQTQKNLHR